MPASPGDEKRRLLATCPLFTAFSPSELDELATRMIERRFADRRVIFNRGDPGSSMMAVVEGRVRIPISSADGKVMLLNIIEPGEIFGELALLDGRPRCADAVALGCCRLFVLERCHFLPVLHRSREAVMQLFGILCDRVRGANEQLEGAVMMSVEARLARLLLVFAARDQTARCGLAARIERPLSQSDLGRLVCASREEVNRHLRRWTADGIIAQDGAALVLHEPQALADLASLADPEKFLPCEPPHKSRPQHRLALSA